MSKKDNKVKYNLRNVHYALMDVATDGTVTYEAPVRIPGAVSLSMSANGEPENFYADGYAYFTISNNMGYEGDLEIALVPDSFRVDVLRETLDSNGVLVENANVETRNFALLFEFDGDVRRIRHLFYYCSVARPNIESQTNEDKIEVRTDKLTLKAAPMENGLVKAKTGKDTADPVYQNWYESVYMPDSETGLKDCSLSALSIGSLALTPAFASDVDSYTAATSNESDTVSATASDSSAEVYLIVNGSVLSSGSSATWDEGENTVIATVNNGGFSNSYTVTVTKG